jgi:SNF2 family DNA or RNA helicase
MKNHGTLALLKAKGGERYWSMSEVLPHVAIRLKQLFPSIRKSSTGPFDLKDTLDNASDIEWFTSRYPMVISEKDKRYLKKVKGAFNKLQSDAEVMLSPNYQPQARRGLKDGQIFRPYQRTALDVIERVQSLLLVDDVGLGKTYEGLGIGLIKGTLPLVIVCEPHLQSQWAEKAGQFIDLKVSTPQGNTPYKLEEADIYIFKYTQLSPWVDVLSSGWVKAIAFDEVQQLRRGGESSKGVAAANICANIAIRVGLTATLIYNYGIEAWNIVNILRPGLLGNKGEFQREWCGNGDVVQNPDALGSYLRESNMILRRTKADVGQVVKQNKPHIEWVESSQSAIKEADELTKSLAITTLTGSFNEAGQAARQFDMRMRQITGIAKASRVAAYARMFIETGTPIILFGWHHEVYEIWKKELKDLNPLFYTGHETAKQKERNKKAFINGESDILIMSLRSGAGVDELQGRAHVVIFGEFDWSPKVHYQCIGRVDRDGQKHNVFVVYVATEDGSDPVMLDVLGVKESQSNGIQDPGKDAIVHTVDINRIKRLAESYLKEKGVELSEPKKALEMDIEGMASCL